MRSPDPKIVILPGMDGTGLLLENFAAALPVSFRAQIVRYPVDGCGSYAEVARFLAAAHLDTEPFIVVAESFSSVASIAWAATKPSNLCGLVVCVGFATPPVRRLLRPISALLTYLLPVLPRPSFVTRHWTAGWDASEDTLGRLRKIRDTVPAATFAARIRAILACNVRAELAQVRIPVLLLGAEDDRLVRRERLEEMRRIQPQAAVEIFPGPHLLLERHASRAAESVARFARECIAEMPSHGERATLR
ncbi:MAG TPA: alpha/beta hydrolase [Acidobacteriaceae bacterium]|nr:alpha/beta hydrolase [Acidobacteriaceae bacterium]